MNLINTSGEKGSRFYSTFTSLLFIKNRGFSVLFVTLIRSRVCSTYSMLSGSRAHWPTARVTLTSSAALVPVNRLTSGAIPFSLRSTRRLVWSLASSDSAPTTFTNTWHERSKNSQIPSVQFSSVSKQMRAQRQPVAESEAPGWVARGSRRPAGSSEFQEGGERYW